MGPDPKTISDSASIEGLAQEFFNIVRKGTKAEFALDLLYLPDDAELQPPTYVCDGLDWLGTQLNRTQLDVLLIAKEAPEPAEEAPS